MADIKVSALTPAASFDADDVIMAVVDGTSSKITGANFAASVVAVQGGLIEDLDTLGAASADGEFMVATAAGVLAWESGATARTSLGLGSIATQAASSVAITGGVIDGTVIGGTTPAAVTGTTITATVGFVGDVTGDVTGDLTGNVTGNVTGDVTGDLTGNVTGNVTGNLTGNVVGNVTGDVTGNADTATALATARTINGTSFDGTANITVTAAAGTLTGTTLAATVTVSSLTQVGTIETGVWQGDVIDSAYIDQTLSVSTLTVSGTTTLRSITYTWPAALGNVGDRLQLGSGGTLEWVATSDEGSATFTSITISNDVDFTGATVADLGSVTTADINGGTIDGTTQASGTINGPIAVGGTWTAAATWTLPAFTLGGTVASNGQSFSGTIANLGSVTTVDINGGSIDGAVIGAASAAAITGTTGTFTSTLSAASIQSTPIGSVTPSTGAFTTLSATGITTLANLTIGAANYITLGTSSYFKAGATQGFLVNNSADTVNLFRMTDAGVMQIDPGAAGGALVLGTTATSSNAQFYATKSYSNASGTDSGIYSVYSQGAATTGGLNVIHAFGQASHTSGVVTNLTGVRSYLRTSGSSTVTLTNAYAVVAQVDAANASSTITNAYGVYINAFTATGTITNRWGLYQAGASENNYLAGSLRIGTTSATSHGQEVLRLSGSQGRLLNLHNSSAGASLTHYTNSGTGTTATDGLIVGLDGGSYLATVFNYEETALYFATNATERVRIDASKNVLYIGDSANASMTAGLTIDQGSATDEAFALKASGYVAHGRTSIAETDTYFSIARYSTALGGAKIAALAEDAATSTVLLVQSQGGTADTTKSTAGVGLIDLYATEHDGVNGLADVTVNGNILSVRARVGGSNLTRLILDEDGDLWLSGGLLTGGASPTFQVTENGNAVIGSAALATTATDGFPYIPSMAGAPTGVPTTYTGRNALVWDSTNDLLKLYDGAWLTIGGPTKRGACYMTTPAATTISVAGTYYKASGTTTSNNLAGFLSSTSNRLTYNGPGTVHVHVVASASITSAGTGVVAGMRLAKNGDATTTDAVATTVRAKINTGTDIADHAAHGDFALSNGDYVELFVTNETNTSTVTVDNLYLFAMAMPTS